MSAAVSRLALSQEDRGRIEEVERLTRAGPESIEALLGLLADPSWAVRRAVVTALARMGDAAVRPLCGVLSGDRRSEARLAATVDTLAAACGNVDDAILELVASVTNTAVLCDAAQVLGRRRSARAVALLARWTAHDDDNVAVAAIEALGRIGGAAALESLVATLRARVFFRTFPAIGVLGSTGDPRAVGPLVELLTDPVYAAEAALALGRTGQIAAVGPLTSLLLAPDERLVGASATALADLLHRYAANFDEVSPRSRLTWWPR